MENQAIPASVSGWNRGATSILRSPRTQPPPCTIIPAEKAPAPSGIEASRRRLTPSTRENSIFFKISAPAAVIFIEPIRNRGNAHLKPCISTTDVSAGAPVSHFPRRLAYNGYGGFLYYMWTLGPEEMVAI